MHIGRLLHGHLVPAASQRARRGQHHHGSRGGHSLVPLPIRLWHGDRPPRVQVGIHEVYLYAPTTRPSVARRPSSTSGGTPRVTPRGVPLLPVRLWHGDRPPRVQVGLPEVYMPLLPIRLWHGDRPPLQVGLPALLPVVYGIELYNLVRFFTEYGMTMPVIGLPVPKVLHDVLIFQCTCTKLAMLLIEL